jgi:hypothetical protein
MVSVSYYTGDIWYHNWHGKYVKGLVIPMFGGYYSFKDAYVQGRQ